MKVDNIESLLESANREIKTDRRKSFLCFIGFMVGLISLLIYVNSKARAHSPIEFYMAMVAMGLLGPLYVFGVQPSKSFQNTATMLAKCDDVRAIPALSLAAVQGSPSLQNAAKSGLIRLLKKVREQDRPLFTQAVLDTQLDLFHRAENLTIALLSAYTYVGGPPELGLAREIIEGKHTPELKEAAEQCAAGILLRFDQDQDSGMLLRTTVESIDDGLLRPTKFENDDEEVQLPEAQKSVVPAKATKTTYRAEDIRQEERGRIWR